MNADKSGSMNVQSFWRRRIEATVAGSGKPRLRVGCGVESAFIGVHRRFHDPFCEGP